MLDTDNKLKGISDCVKCSYMMIIKKTYMDFHKEGPGTSTYEVRGRSSRRSARVFLCPGLASTFSLVRAMSVDHSYRFLKMLTILEHFTILYTCDKVDKILKLWKYIFRSKSVYRWGETLLSQYDNCIIYRHVDNCIICR